MNDNAMNRFQAMRPENGSKPAFYDTDPDYSEIITNFILDEVHNEIDLPETDKSIAILSVLIGSQSLMLYKEFLRSALNLGLSPITAKEIVYQATAYLGTGRVFPFVAATNEVMTEKGIELPLPSQKTVTPETRLTDGNQKQIDYFGEGMRARWEVPSETAHIQKWLADNCFGDYYTRTGMTDQQREMATFCFVYSQGGCEPQATAHAMGNMNIGNTKEYLIKVVSLCVPYMGYPRSLNALTCIENAVAALAGRKDS